MSNQTYPLYRLAKPDQAFTLEMLWIMIIFIVVLPLLAGGIIILIMKYQQNKLKAKRLRRWLMVKESPSPIDNTEDKVHDPESAEDRSSLPRIASSKSVDSSRRGWYRRFSLRKSIVSTREIDCVAMANVARKSIGSVNLTMMNKSDSRITESET